VSYQSAQQDLRKRFFILFLLIAVAGATVAVRMFWLTVVQGDKLARAAEDRLDIEMLLPTWRGKLLDRKGRVLAEDVASYDVAVSFPLAKGEWARARALVQARADAGAAWKKLSPEKRNERVDALCADWSHKQEALIQILAIHAGLSESELRDRMSTIASRIEKQSAGAFKRQLEIRAARGQSLDIKQEPSREMREMQVVFRDVPDESAREIRKISDAYPGAVEIVDAAHRRLPWQSSEVEVSRTYLPSPIRSSVALVLKLDGALDQIVGSVRAEAWKEDLDRRPFERVLEDGSTHTDLGGYRIGRESVGARGMERQFEDELRGFRGQASRRLDSTEEQRIEPIPGKDVRLSIDAQLQLRVQAALDPRTGLTTVQSWHSNSEALVSGDALPAAAVIVDVATGEVLVAASTPLPQDQPRGGRVSMASETAGINRALNAAYPPGSLVKPLVYLAAVAEGVARENETVECNGHFFKERTDAARCWIYRDKYKFTTHSKTTGGPLGVEEALARSCNIYFYTLANRLGAARLCEWYRRFGLGTMGGTIPSAQAAALIDAKHDQFSVVSLGIGQGAMTITPLEMANAYAMAARAGSVRTPTFRAGAGSTSAVYAFSPTAVSRTLDGLRRVVEENYGTGNHMDVGGENREPIIQAPGVRVWAKTGTAEAPPLKIDRDHDGVAERIVTDADHAWCAALVGNQGDSMPRYAIAVIVEHGGSGGRTAGPVTGAVIRALVAEGYLVGDGKTNSRVTFQLGADR